MDVKSTQFRTLLARDPADIAEAQALRYGVFVAERGGDGPLVDHGAGREIDRFDSFAEHLILKDTTRPQGRQVVGVYRLMDEAAARAAGRYSSEDEYDLGPLRATGRPLLELGRSCLHRDYRGGAALMHLWQGVAQVVRDRGAEFLFGVASFAGTDVAAHADALSILTRDHRAPEALRVRSRAYQEMALSAQTDRLAAMRGMPPLIKAYLRLGGFVGEGAFVDHRFNTTDVCMILDVARMSARHRAIYAGGP